MSLTEYAIKKRLIDGYPTEIFIERAQVEKYYLCPLCLCAVRDPVQCKQGHLFCKMCIERVIASKPICPCDNKEPLTLATLSSNLVVKNMMNDMGVVCIECEPHSTYSSSLPSTSKSAKCDWKGVLSEIENHSKVCEYVMEACSYKGCSVTCMRKALNQHKIQCEFGMSNCSFKGCGKRIRVNDLPDHKEKCFFRAFQCICRRMIYCLDNADHKLTNCPNQIIPCPVPSQCCCSKSFSRANANSAIFPFHSQAIIDMKRENHLLKLLLKAVVTIFH